MKDFPPTRDDALARLKRFIPHAGRDYAARRNYDLGPGAHDGVSTLSPYVRRRILTEEEVLSAVLSRHSRSAAEKYVQEVFWRTYWKGWLEMRPEVWQQYQTGLRRALDDVQTQSGLRDGWVAACKGNTGIACFDAWAQELARTGYLHNHARMWFASIWIFTLRLPWELGADFFLRHLLDGDPASNTLSWRWVGGLQTVGKTYLARPDNIAKYTEGRFGPVTGLATSAHPLPPLPAPERRPLPLPDTYDKGRKTGILLHGEDLSPAALPRDVPAAVIRAETALSPLQLAPHVPAFIDAALSEAQTRYGFAPDLTATQPEEIADWAASHGLEQIVTAHAPVGPEADLLDAIARVTDIPLIRLRRDYDSACWPYATHGFFRFREKIPNLLNRFGL